jgi:hypothetical protein
MDSSSGAGRRRYPASFIEAARSDAHLSTLERSFSSTEPDTEPIAHGRLAESDIVTREPSSLLAMRISASALHARDETQVKRRPVLITIDACTRFLRSHFPTTRDDHKIAANQGGSVRSAARVIVHVGKRAPM